jgi:hypothetical protein
VTFERLAHHPSPAIGVEIAESNDVNRLFIENSLKASRGITAIMPGQAVEVVVEYRESWNADKQMSARL